MTTQGGRRGWGTWLGRWGLSCGLVVLLCGSGGGAWALSLDEAMERAAANTEAAELLRLRVAAADGQRKQALGGVLPTLELGASVTLNDREVEVGDSAFTNRLDPSAAITGRMELFRGTSIPAWLAAADGVEAERERARWERATLRFAAADAYMRALTAIRNVEAARDALRVAEESQRQAEARHETGFGLRSDVSQARLAVLEAQSAELDAESARDDALDLLAFLVNLAEVAGEALQEPESARLADPAEVPRADLAALRAEHDAAIRRVRGEQLAFLPSLALTGQYNVGRSSLRAPDGTFWQLTLSANWVIFDFARYGRLDERRAQRDRVALERAERERDIARAMRGAERRVIQAGRRLEVAEEAVEVAGEAQELVQVRFELGETTAFEVVEADNALFRAQTQRNLAQLELSLARLELARERGALQDERGDE